MYALSVKECLSFGWNAFKARPWLYIGITLLLIVMSLIAEQPRSWTEPAEGDPMTLLSALGFTVTMFLSFLVSLGKNHFYLKAHDAPGDAKPAQVFQLHPYWKFLIASVLAGAATLIGLILFIIPGIYIGILVGFTLYVVVDTGKGPIDAMKRSAQITKGNRWNLFLLGVAILGINVLGVLCLLIGLLVSLPVSTLTLVHAYRKLSDAMPENSLAAEPVPAQETVPVPQPA